MSADDIRVATIVVPNPEYDRSKSARIISSSLAYSLHLSNSFETVSHNNPNRFGTIEGLLYVPTLPDTANVSCSEAQSLIPENVATLADFPLDQDYPLITVFPWTASAECTLAYLAQARADNARGAFTFLPGVSDDIPDDNEPTWNLSGSDAWKGENQFPVYALTATASAAILRNLALYTGNMSNVPNGRTLSQQYDPRDFPRLFAHVDLQGGTDVPSLWMFLIIVLAVLLGIVIVASVVMHFIQMHQRKTLRRRLERGEVDLEALGIKKMNVPQAKIDAMPRYVYTGSVAASTPANIPVSKRASAVAPHATSFSQTTCPICLDDFVCNETEVRELPCKHIFHPECIDLFLRDTSSLCPMCKKSALPAGYCPVKVTNLMVRRERLVRRMRERRRQNMAAQVARANDLPPPPTNNGERAVQWLQTRFGRSGNSVHPHTVEMTDSQRGMSSAAVEPPANPTTPQQPEQAATTISSPTTDPELGRPSSQATPVAGLNTRRHTLAVPPNIAAQGSNARRAWRRERLARQQEEQYNQQAETTRQVDVGRPLWRRIASRVIPGVD